MRHFALDFSLKQSVHGGQSQALALGGQDRISQH
jgi:hypothetical protein